MTNTENTKVTGLTALQVEALRLLTTTHSVDVTATTATFHLTPADALQFVLGVKAGAVADFGATGHPVASLHAVIRKVRKLAEK